MVTRREGLSEMELLRGRRISPVKFVCCEQRVQSCSFELQHSDLQHTDPHHSVVQAVAGVQAPIEPVCHRSVDPLFTG